MTPSHHDDDTWPRPAAPAALLRTRETYVPPTPPERRVGAGMVLALAALALVGLGFLITYLVVHRDNGPAAAPPPATAAPPPTTAASTGTASAAAMVPVPDLRGVKVTHARAALTSVGLRPRQTVVASDRPGGTVIAESPLPGAHVAKGSQVLLSVARGTPQAAPGAASAVPTTTTTAVSTSTPTATAAAAQPRTVTVPDLSGQREAEAVQALGTNGLLPSLTWVPSTDPLGTVEAQARQAGTALPYHTHVQVNLSAGPGPKPSEQVPNVVGRGLRQAVSALNAAHLRLIYLRYPVGSKAKAGTIVQQSPLGGASAPRNAQVLVFVGAYEG